jgi:sucrose phosphorylase
LTPAAIDALVETIHARSGGQSRLATGAAATNLDLYQVNCTSSDALGRRDEKYLLARALQFFAPGIPQVYCVGLLAGENDMDLLARTSVGRDINRHYYQPPEVDAALRRPVVRALLDLIRFRNAHPAFNGEFAVHSASPLELSLMWRAGDAWAALDANFANRTATVRHSTAGGTASFSLATLLSRESA